LLKEYNYTLLVTAKWCKPCRILENDLKEMGLEDKIEQVINTTKVWQVEYFIYSLKKHNIYVSGAVPTLITKLNNNRIYIFLGYNCNEKSMYHY